MSQEQFKSAAFQNAELKSEHLRIFAVLVFVAIFILVTTVRVFVIRTAAQTTSGMWSYILASVVIGYELWTLHKVNLALRTGASPAAAFWILSTILETSIPALAIAFLTSQHVEAAYRPLASPAALVFFIFNYSLDTASESLDRRLIRHRCQHHLPLCSLVPRLANDTPK